MIRLEAFKTLLTRCWPTTPKRVVVALSGGVDSMCLTYLLAKYRDTYNRDLSISAITIDHGYRPDSAQEAEAVGSIVSQWGVDHHIRRLCYDTSISQISNFEELAREKRYHEFQKLCRELDAGCLVVAHNMNDQIETYVQRLSQNSTVFGLAGLQVCSNIPINESTPENSPIKVVRPLLSCSKSSIIETCKANGVQWFEDSTNADIHLTQRNLYRYMIQEYIPQEVQTRPELACVSWDALVSSHQEVVGETQAVENSVGALIEQLETESRITAGPKNGSVVVMLHPAEICDDLVLSRMLFRLLYPYSSVKHYHWMYSKLLNRIAPRIINSHQHNKSDKFTYLNLVFDITHTEGSTSVLVSRQPIITEQIAELSLKIPVYPTQNKWVLFDRRFWLRLSSEAETQVQVVPYSVKSHRKLLQEQFPHAEIPGKSGEGVPLVIDADGKMAVPTYGLVHPQVHVEWRPKPNVYRQ